MHAPIKPARQTQAQILFGSGLLGGVEYWVWFFFAPLETGGNFSRLPLRTVFEAVQVTQECREADAVLSLSQTLVISAV